MALPVTFQDLQTTLRMRLNDTDSGRYQDSEIQYCLNLAYRESVVAGKTYKTSKTLTLSAGTPTYDCVEIFEVLHVQVNGQTVDPANMAEIGIGLINWENVANGQPTKWMQLNGGMIRVSPAPDSATVAANPNMYVSGYAMPTDMASNTDTPSALQDGYAVSAVLDRAEAEARRMRANYAGNSALATALLQSWMGWIQAINASTKG